MLRVYASGDDEVALDVECRATIAPFNGALVERKVLQGGIVEFTLIIPNKATRACKYALLASGFSSAPDDVERGDVIYGSRKLSTTRSVLAEVFRYAEMSLSVMKNRFDLTPTEQKALSTCQEVLGIGPTEAEDEKV